MQKVFEKETKTSKLWVEVNTYNRIIRIKKLMKWDGAKEETISLSYPQAAKMFLSVLAAFPNETAELFKGLYDNYSNENTEK